MKLAGIVVFLLIAASAFAGIDGKWVAETKTGGKKGKEAKTATMTFDFKTQGNQLQGSVSAGARKRARGAAIQDGKVEGDRFSFTTVQKSKKGEQKVRWEGAVQGDELRGTRTREGGRRGQSFTAKRSS